MTKFKSLHSHHLCYAEMLTRGKTKLAKQDTARGNSKRAARVWNAGGLRARLKDGRFQKMVEEHDLDVVFISEFKDGAHDNNKNLKALCEANIQSFNIGGFGYSERMNEEERGKLQAKIEALLETKKVTISTVHEEADIHMKKAKKLREQAGENYDIAIVMYDAITSYRSDQSEAER